jgi:hypothetical protein
VTPVGIGNGSVRGGVGDGHEAQFGNAPGYPQCLPPPVLDTAPTLKATQGNVTCGFVTDADFFVQPRIPEPGSLALFGAALLAGLAVRRKVKKA